MLMVISLQTRKRIKVSFIQTDESSFFYLLNDSMFAYLDRTQLKVLSLTNLTQPATLLSIYRDLASTLAIGEREDASLTLLLASSGNTQMVSLNRSLSECKVWEPSTLDTKLLDNRVNRTVVRLWSGRANLPNPAFAALNESGELRFVTGTDDRVVYKTKSNPESIALFDDVAIEWIEDSEQSVRCLFFGLPVNQELVLCLPALQNSIEPRTSEPSKGPMGNLAHLDLAYIS